jgi:hypothetical protein
MELPSQQDFQAFQDLHGNTLPGILAQIVDVQNINAVINGIPGAQQNDTARKTRVRQLYNEMVQYHNQLKNVIQTIEQEHTTVANSVKAMKERVHKITHDLHKKTELAELRKEQASDVKQKNNADMHSSVLGLWRPLHIQTRGVLYTTSVVFILLSVVAIVFLGITQGSQIFPAKSSTTTTTNAKGSGSNFQSSSMYDTSNNQGRVAGGSIKHFRPKK